MRDFWISAQVAAILLAPSVSASAGNSRLSDGLYEVSVTLDMGVLEDLNARKAVKVCLDSAAPDGAHGLFLLSDNIQLAHCPVRNAKEQNGTLTFEIVCDGIDAGRASAAYTLDKDAFEGRLTMRMGGKNMTMREAQSGRRIGNCPPE